MVALETETCWPLESTLPPLCNGTLSGCRCCVSRWLWSFNCSSTMSNRVISYSNSSSVKLSAARFLCFIFCFIFCFLFSFFRFCFCFCFSRLPLLLFGMPVSLVGICSRCCRQFFSSYLSVANRMPLPVWSGDAFVCATLVKSKSVAAGSSVSANSSLSTDAVESWCADSCTSDVLAAARCFEVSPSFSAALPSMSFNASSSDAISLVSVNSC